jgi:hypothetical protein
MPLTGAIPEGPSFFCPIVPLGRQLCTCGAMVSDFRRANLTFKMARLGNETKADYHGSCAVLDAVARPKNCVRSAGVLEQNSLQSLVRGMKDVGRKRLPAICCVVSARRTHNG